MKRKLLICLMSLCTVTAVSAQSTDSYRYQIDLNKVTDDKLTVELSTPKLTQKQATFYLPKIVPGTYRFADYGKFVSQFSAFDTKGKALPVKQTSDNSWVISSADKLSKISYQVEDTWESKIAHDIYDMAGTNIEENKNYVINTPGFFGYFDGLKKIPFELTFKKPQGFYGSSPLSPKKSAGDTDVFVVNNADELYDSPLMFCKPDTTTIKLGKTSVLISTYSPNKLVTSQQIAGILKDLLKATEHYLGGKLPVNKYAFIFYFNGEQAELTKTGALEHNYSSFYALPEYPFEQFASLIQDICAHEFFHIVTPLTISSREVKEFNFNEPVLSKHLWLYEGSTEYYSDHAQVVEGLQKPEEFLAKLNEKITSSRNTFNDNLPFTELSKECAGKHKEQYNNVYEKGALISAALDLYLLKLSSGAYSLRNLKHDLGIKYGKDAYFEDDKLFDVITELTFPEVRDFFKKYVEGPEAIPYEQFFAYAGVDLKNSKSPSLGGIQLNPTPEGNITIVGVSPTNPFGKAIGFREGDELVSLNGQVLNVQTAGQLFDQFRKTVKEGDPVEVKVKRKNESGAVEEMTLKANAIFIEVKSLELNPNPTPEQMQVRSAWLGLSSEKKSPAVPEVTAKPEDVNTIDGVIKALYEVISGPAGPRDWNRFRSLFYKDAYMGTMGEDQNGKLALEKFSPEEYIKFNGPMFAKFGFYEKELGRTQDVFGNISQVFTAYEFTVDTPSPMKQRGINSVELIKENNRWYITSIVWTEETKENPIPAQYIKSTTSKK